MTRRWWTPALAPLAGIVVLGNVAGCQPPSSPAAPAKSAAPSRVSAPAKESDLATVTLVPEAETRLGLALVPVERTPVPRTSTYGGEVIIPPGRLISVASPFSATIQAPAGAEVPHPGQAVQRGQPIFVLVPILSPESRATMAPLLIEAEGQVNRAARIASWSVQAGLMWCSHSIDDGEIGPRMLARVARRTGLDPGDL